MDKEDKPITGIEHKYEILKQSKSNNLNRFKYDVLVWDYVDRVDPLKIWNNKDENIKNKETERYIRTMENK